MNENLPQQPITPEHKAELPPSTPEHTSPDVVALGERIKEVFSLDDSEREGMLKAYQSKLEAAKAAGKPTAFFEKMITKYSGTSVEASAQEKTPDKPKSSSENIAANASTIGKLQSEISALFKSPYSIYQGGHELQAANNAIDYETSALRQAKIGENPDVDVPAAEGRLSAAQQRYIAALESLKAEKQATLTGVNKADGVIKDESINNAAEAKPEAPDGDPRNAFEIRMAYQNVLNQLGGNLSPELITLKARVDLLPPDATENEKRGPHLAFLRAYKSSLN